MTSDRPQSLPAQCAASAHRWLARHRYILWRDASLSVMVLNYIVLIAVPVFPLAILIQWLVTNGDDTGDDLDFKAVVFLGVALYLFTLSAVNLWTPWGDLAGAKEMALWGCVVLGVTVMYKVLPD